MDLDDKTIEKLEKQFRNFENKVPIYDAIVSFIKDTEFGERYPFKKKFTEGCFFVEPEEAKKIDKAKIKTDLYFYDPIGNSIILIEETFNPLEKENQLRAYIHIDKDSLGTATQMQKPPNLDIFLIVPYEAVGDARNVYNRVIDEGQKKKLGNNFGLTLWYYDKKYTKMTKFAGRFSSSFLRNLNKNVFLLKPENYGNVYETNSIIEVLRRILLIPYEQVDKDKKREEEVCFTKEKIMEYFRRFGMNNESIFKEALDLGEKIDLLIDVDLDAMYARPKYYKNSSQSIKYIMEFCNNPIRFIKDFLQKKKKPKRSSKQLKERAIFYNARVNVIIDWLKDLHDLGGKANYKEVVEKRGFSQPHVYNKACILLGFIKKDKNKKVELTELGKKFLEETDKKVKSDLFHKTAYENSILYREVYNKFLEIKKMTLGNIEETMQDIRKKYGKKIYQESSLHAFSGVLLDWLVFAKKIKTFNDKKMYFIQN
jgi:hypothetical protein